MNKIDWIEFLLSFWRTCSPYVVGLWKDGLLYFFVWTDALKMIYTLFPPTSSVSILLLSAAIFTHLFLTFSLTFCIFLSASSKTISGLLEFDNKTEAVEVLTVLNHYQIRIPSKSVCLISSCMLNVQSFKISRRSLSMMLTDTSYLLGILVPGTGDLFSSFQHGKRHTAQ